MAPPSTSNADPTTSTATVVNILQQHQPNKFDIIRSDFKDKYYKSWQRTLVTRAFSSLPHINNDQCRLISDCLYYSLTTLIGHQTLGEECYYLVELGPRNSIPSLIQRVLMVALKVYVPYVTRRISNLRWLRSVLVFLHKLNELVFLFSRKLTFYNLENRFSRISYLSLTGNPSGSQQSQSGLKLITALKTINLALLGANLIRRWRKDKLKRQMKPVREVAEETKTSEPSEKVEPGNKCSICLEALKGATLTTCGHLFCWQCLQSYALNVNNSSGCFNCPSCRLSVKMNKLIFLHNF